MPGILQGHRVIDLSRYIAGPYCAMLLGDMGADVIKVERPGGEEARYMKPAIGDLSTYFMIINRNKRSITLNFKNPTGKKILLELLENTDVLIENFRPGVMKRLGLGWETLHSLFPRLIMVSISGFGQEGPYAQRPGFDSVAQAMGGLMNQTGDDKPVVCGTWVGDYSAGLHAAFATALALYDRQTTGCGQHIDVALLDSVFGWLRTAAPDFLLFQKKHNRKGARDTYRCPVGTFETKDGYIYITATTPQQFENLCQVANHPEWATDERFSTENARLENSEELTKKITAFTKTVFSKELLERLTAADVPCAPINDIEQVLENPQIQYRKQLVWTETSDGIRIPVPGIVPKLSNKPGDIRLAPPHLGEHNNEVYNGLLGMSDDEISELKKEGVI